MPGTPYARLRALRRVLISDVDGTLLEGGKAGRGCAALAERLAHAQAGLVLATGRDLELTRQATTELMAAGLPRPEAFICSVGSEIYLGEDERPDEAWAQHLADGWDAPAVRRALAGLPGLVAQDDVAQRRFKASYFFSDQASPTTQGAGTPEGATAVRAAAVRVSEARAREITAAARQTLAAAGLRARLIPSASSFLDVLPARASKGAAVAWLVSLAAFDPRGVIVAGDSGNDREMLLGEPGDLELDGLEQGGPEPGTPGAAGDRWRNQPLRAVIVGNREPELDDLAGRPHVYLAERNACAGVLEGLLAHGW